MQAPESRSLGGGGLKGEADLGTCRWMRYFRMGGGGLKVPGKVSRRKVAWKISHLGMGLATQKGL